MRQTELASARRTAADAGRPTSDAVANPRLEASVSDPQEVVIGVNGEIPGTELPASIANRIVAAGGKPLRLYPGGPGLDAVQALVLVGGGDVRAERYGETPHPKNSVISEAREAFDLRLVADAMKLQIPTLGICLGAQEIWIVRNGSLIQDIPSELGTRVNHRAREYGHWVSLIKGTKLEHLYGQERRLVYSNHHQAVDAAHVPAGLTVSAHSPDGLAEAFEATEPSQFVIGVNWHPEQKDDELLLFRAVVHAAQAHQAR